jgi:hypothetical protein
LVQVIPVALEYVDERGRVLVKVNKALYGLIQSAKLWFLHLTNVLEQNGFVANALDAL